MDDIRILVEQLKLQVPEIQNKYQIALLTNSRSQTRMINGQKMEFSDYNEFFSDQEYSEIYNGIQAAGFYVNSFFNEINFIAKILEESYYKNNKLVYNLSRNGKHVGKKSLIPSFCDLMAIPYTGSNALITSFCRAKYMYTKYLEAHKINTPKTWVFSGNNRWINQEKPTFGTKVVIKPMHESASIGLDMNSIFIFDENTLLILEGLYSPTNRPILLQQFIEGYECEVPLFVSDDDIHAMEPVGISIDGNNKLKSDILTYEHSFHDQYEFYSLSDELRVSTTKHVKNIAIQVAQLTNLTNYGRIDFRIDYNGIPYLIDIATSPYTTSHSSFAYSFSRLQLAYEDIYSTIISLVYKHSEFK
ncbi:hypothetical protein [Paenibacillus sp. IHBB 10380]|uniref:hypothetical protein n=1 Tax=Paenibacillus sp. IHBB 10380 TaxID=1566358 RepID=UPI0006965167|nr:hypothetical protein [Paenibacillus sp. IHBB 10380]